MYFLKKQRCTSDQNDFLQQFLCVFSTVATKITIPHIFIGLLIYSAFTSYTRIIPYTVIHYSRLGLPFLLTGIVLLYALIKNEGKVYHNRYLLVMVLYIIWMNITGLMHPESWSDTKLWFEKSNFAFICGFLSFFVFDKKHLKYLGWTLVVMAVVNTAVVYFQIATNALEPTSFASDRNLFSRFQTIAHTFLLIQWVKDGAKLNDFKLIPLALIFLSIFPQQSRSGILLYLIASAIVIFFSTNKRLIVISGLAAIVMGALLVVPLTKRSDLNSGAPSISDLGRISSAAGAINMIKEKPITGIGYFRSYYNFEKYENKNLPGIYGMNTIHNVLLGVWAETGLIGLVLFVYFNFGLLYYLFKKHVLPEKRFTFRADALFATIAVFVYQLHGLVYHDANYESFYWYSILYGMLIIKGNPEIREDSFDSK